MSAWLPDPTGWVLLGVVYVVMTLALAYLVGHSNEFPYDADGWLMLLWLWPLALAALAIAALPMAVTEVLRWSVRAAFRLGHRRACPATPPGDGGAAGPRPR